MIVGTSSECCAEKSWRRRSGLTAFGKVVVGAVVHKSSACDFYHRFGCGVRIDKSRVVMIPLEVFLSPL
ncbi:hypothetical protein J6590_019374 [Homalodisca vitripennis]|nr:hypothetical protein J6590_019374 [Homalodisca vitripennis]